MTCDASAPASEPAGIAFARRQMREMLFGSMLWPRAWLVLIAAAKAVIFALPGDSLSRPLYHYMQILFPEPIWLSFLALYALLGGACLLGVCKHWLRLVTDAYGLALFGAMAVSLSLGMLTLYPIAVSLPAQIMLAASAFWIFVRSALEK